MLDSAQFAPAMNCHLLVSDLLWPAIAGAASCAELELPALETLMARSQRDLIGGGSIERWLAARFGADRAGNRNERYNFTPLRLIFLSKYYQK